MKEVQSFRFTQAGSFKLRCALAASVLCVVAFFAAFSAPGADARGNPALDQYVEQVPGAGGDKNVDDPGSKDPGGVLGDQNYAGFEELGEDGIAAAALAASAVSPESARKEPTSKISKNGSSTGP